MPPDVTNDQELMLKKRARRRLVGAVALVVLMVIILPQMLQDRALLAKQAPIRITMPTQAETDYPQSAAVKAQEQVSQTAAAPLPDVISNDVQPSVAEPVQDEKTATTPAKDIIDKSLRSNLPQQEKKSVPKDAEPAKTDIASASQSQESFTVQVGVYSDVENVKRIQSRLKAAGFSTQTEKIRTSKGESLRLKAGSFTTRQDAVTAQTKIKAIGLPGIVISNE